MMQNICVFLLKVARPTISPQSGEGDMHQVPCLRTKVGPQFSRIEWEVFQGA